MSSLEEKSVILRASQEFLSGRRLSTTLMEAFVYEDKALRRYLGQSGARLGDRKLLSGRSLQEFGNGGKQKKKKREEG